MTTEIWEAQNFAFAPNFIIALLLTFAAGALALIAQNKEGKTKAALAVATVALLCSTAFALRAGYPAKTTEHAVTHETLKVQEISGGGFVGIFEQGRYAIVEGKPEKVYIPLDSAINYADTLEVYCLEGEEQRCIAIGKTDDPKIAVGHLLSSGLLPSFTIVEKVG